MSEFVKVVGRDPEYSMIASHQWIHAATVVKIYPIYAVIDENGKFWAADPRHDQAEIVSYGLIDASGDRYSCADADELAKLGFVITEDRKTDLGFVQSDDEEPPVGIDLNRPLKG